MKPEDIKFIIVHCSKTPTRMGGGLKVVQRKCRLRGTLSIGYHYVISRNGTVERGRPLDEAGNHLVGFNDKSIGICLVGMPGQAKPSQVEALWRLLEILHNEYPNARVATHEEIQPSTAEGCPGFKLKGGWK